MDQHHPQDEFFIPAEQAKLRNRAQSHGGSHALLVPLALTSLAHFTSCTTANAEICDEKYGKENKHRCR